MLDKFKFFKKQKKEKQNPKIKPKINVDANDLNVDDFNNWFKNEYSGYGGYPGSAKGIFLRTDKLSSGMIEDYFNYLNITSDSYKFMDIILDDWFKKLRK